MHQMILICKWYFRREGGGRASRRCEIRPGGERPHRGTPIVLLQRHLTGDDEEWLVMPAVASSRNQTGGVITAAAGSGACLPAPVGHRSHGPKSGSDFQHNH